MSFRGVVALGMLVAAAGAERLANFAVRSFIAIDLSQREGMTAASIGVSFTALSIGSVLAMFIGAGLVLAFGPRLTACLGAFLGAIGLSAMALGAPILLGWSLYSIGAGVFRVCLFVAAAAMVGTEQSSRTEQSIPSAHMRAPDPRRFLRLAAFAATTYAASNVGAFLAAPIAGMLREYGGSSLGSAFAAAAALCAGALAFAGMTVGTESVVARAVPDTHDAPYRVPAPLSVSSPPAPVSMRPLAGAALLACVLGALHVGEAAIGATPSLVATKDIAWLYAMRAGITMIVGLIAAVVLLAGAVVGSSGSLGSPGPRGPSRSPASPRAPLPFFGAAMAIAGLGLVVGAFAGPGLAVLVAASGLTAFGVVAMSIGTAYVALAVPGRKSGIALAAWFAVASFAGIVGAPLAYTALRTPLLVVVGLVCLASGIATAAFGRALHRTWFDPPPV